MRFWKLSLLPRPGDSYVSQVMLFLLQSDTAAATSFSSKPSEALVGVAGRGGLGWKLQRADGPRFRSRAYFIRRRLGFNHGILGIGGWLVGRLGGRLGGRLDGRLGCRFGGVPALTSYSPHQRPT